VCLEGSWAAGVGGMQESWAIARKYALQKGSRYDLCADQEAWALGFANIVASFSGAYPVCYHYGQMVQGYVYSHLLLNRTLCRATTLRGRRSQDYVLLGCVVFKVAGSFTRTAVAAENASRTPAQNVVTSFIVIVVLNWCTGLVKFVPEAVRGWKNHDPEGSSP
jgi:MFS superfamily sulfate permease-like transporter